MAALSISDEGSDVESATVSDLKSNFDMTGVSTVYEAAKCQMVGLGRKKVKEGKWKNGWKMYFPHLQRLVFNGNLDS